MIELRLSAHSLEIATCPWRYYMYRIMGRARAEVGPALVQGIAWHAALASWRKGESVEAQEAAIDTEFAAHQLPADDFRTPDYLKQVLAQYRAEHAAEGWVWEEVEKEFEVELAVYPKCRNGVLIDDVRVVWTGRRDAVGFDRVSGERYVFDEKTASRDESADNAAAANSCALKGYVWSWNQEHPDKPLAGAYLRRTVIRAPTKPKPCNFSLPPDPPIRFPQSRLDEWRQGVLDRARLIAERDPTNPAAWWQEESQCRFEYGCCDYLETCVLPPGEDRRRMLESPLFGPTHRDEGKP